MNRYGTEAIETLIRNKIKTMTEILKNIHLKISRVYYITLQIRTK